MDANLMSQQNVQSYRHMNSCLACGENDLHTYLDLGTQPLANSFHDGKSTQLAFPLASQICPACFHSQLTVAVNPDLLYQHYLYVSGTTRTLHDYFSWFVDQVEQKLGTNSLSVLDIASNDGSLLSQFKQHGHQVQGVDPAENLRVLSEEKGIPTLVDYWSTHTAIKLGQKYDVIIAMNVLGHISTPFDFLLAAAQALAPGGLIFLQTSQADIFRNGEFDTIYHEHHSFFTMRSLRTLAKRVGLTLVHSQKVRIHGNSYLWTLTHDSSVIPDNSVAEMEQEETEIGYYDLATYTHFGNKAREAALQVSAAVEQLRRQGIPVIGYGAAAKGNTFINFAQLKLDFIVDDNLMKFGLLTPGMDIPVVDPQTLSTVNEPLAIVILAWNFFDEIIERIRAQRPGHADIFIRYFPTYSQCAAA